MKKRKLLLFFTLFSFLFIFFSSYKFNEKNYENLNYNLVKTNSPKNEEIFVYPSGESCGIKILSDGILVISVTDINDIPSPSKKAGIMPGDFVKKINGVPLKDADDFIKTVKETNGEFTLEYERNSVVKSCTIKPVKINGENILGMWVRDSIAGIGTLTFYSKDKSYFAALGHSIADLDTGETMPVKNGELVYSKIISCKKGEAGNPGGLSGIFLDDSKVIGNIYDNSDFGLYGKTANCDFLPPQDLIPIGYKSEVHTGEAEIISTIDGNNPERFKIEIVKINKQNNPDVKGMLIKVTDKKLLEKTGGIIQGMSGSPIIQNGKLIGAVTHVLVNDPTRGYGIFIENMLAKAEKIK
ncbi:MAG: SpoIVB peptidase [Clostridia bacterium]|nr:SpoIVB peptidase [Oscillospiraceae bacterium]MBR4892423.1 SpoIVB peptidase [Clostridia bacterium]